jgi:hypothetical protein
VVSRACLKLTPQEPHPWHFAVAGAAALSLCCRWGGFVIWLRGGGDGSGSATEGCGDHEIPARLPSHRPATSPITEFAPEPCSMINLRFMITEIA